MSTTKQPIAHTLLARAHSPSTAQTLYTTKLQSRPLYLKPSSPPPQTAQQARRLARTSKSKSKRKPKPLTSREKHALQKAHPINPTSRRPEESTDQQCDGGEIVLSGLSWGDVGGGTE
ncbi:hypothetical protein M7I_5487 [Glarea lozoyensis 74030]|uniref:Uncharacterized protein n=1 Tax=Glarea lozoyensis (strain ATCC 74030 / MF5533) TaxID=1104152 RepID=H0ES13_GLAL7|nr:hypothetical protein M7I_5487 [Glarea lozoyensis 74030]